MTKISPRALRFLPESRVQPGESGERGCDPREPHPSGPQPQVSRRSMTPDLPSISQVSFQSEICLKAGAFVLEESSFSRRIHNVLAAGLFDYWLGQAIRNSTVCRKAPNTITVRAPLSLKVCWVSADNNASGNFVDLRRWKIITIIKYLLSS